MNVHKNHPPTIFGFYMFHCFNISEHISISVLFFIISISCIFAGFLKIIVPGWGFSTIFLPLEVEVSHFICAPGVGISPFQKIPQGLDRGGGGIGIGID